MLRALIITLILALLAIATLAIVRIRSAPAPRDYGPDFARLTESLQPDLRPDDAVRGLNGWRVAEDLGRHVNQVLKAPYEEDADYLFAFNALWDDEATPERRALAHRGMEIMEASGIFERTPLLRRWEYASMLDRGETPSIDRIESVRRSITTDLSRVLGVKVQHELHKGNFGIALDRFEDAVGLAQIFYRQPTKLEHLRGHASVSSSLEALLGRVTELDAAALDRIDRALASIAADMPVTEPVEGERLISLSLLNTAPALHRGGLVRKTNEYYDAVVVLAQAPPAARATDPRLLQLAERADRIAQSDALGREYEPAPWSGYIRSLDTMIAQIRASRIVIALAKYRTAHGIYPDTLESLDLDETYNAPREGFRIIYSRTEDGYILYDVGADGVDNGGTPHPYGGHSAYSNNGPGSDFVHHALP